MDKIGLRLGSVYLRKFRVIRHGGSPSAPSIISSDSDRADSLAWTHFLFGNWSATAQVQTSSASGTVSGAAGTSQSSQVQTELSEGTASAFTRLQSSTGHGLALRSVYAIKSYPYRHTWIIAKPTDGSSSRGWIWHDWFFGIGSIDGQGSQSSVSSGTVSGSTGASATGQASQTSAAAGTVSGIAGTSSSGQATQSSDASGEETFYSATVVTGGVEISSVTTRVYDSDTGEELWNANHGGTVRCVAIDDNGNVYTGGDSGTDGYYARKYSSTGSLLWSINTGGTVFGIAVDSSGNVYLGGLFTSSNTIRKYDSDGTEITSGWPSSLGNVIRNLSIGSTNYLYATGNRDGSNITTRAYSSNGGVAWTYDHGTDTYATKEIEGLNYTALVGAQGPSPTYYSTHVLSASYGTSSYNYNNGAIVWSVDYGNDLGGVVDNRLLLAVGSALKSCDYDNLGTFHWTAGHGDTIFGVAVSRFDGSIYIVGNRASSITTRKYQRDGTEITTGWQLDHGGTLYAVAWSPFRNVPAVQAPAIPISLAIGIPAVRKSYTVPGLGIPLAIGIPTISGGLPLVPPEFPDGAERVFYRAYLTGGDTLLEIPMASFQCKRRRGESTWLVVESPGASQPLVDLIRARIELGASILIYCGIHNAAGTESVGELLRATMTDTDYARSPQNAPLRVTARVDTPTYTLTSRTLLGVSKRGKDTSGRRTATCRIDPLLRPGDEVDDGLYTPWIVGALEYQVGPSEAGMTVVEES